MRVALTAVLALATLAATLAAALIASPRPAKANSCAPIDEREQRRAADVVFEGVVLSGPRTFKDMASPARFHVQRYLKGRGPEVVRVGTGDLQVKPGDYPALLGVGSGELTFDPGQVWRIYGDTPGSIASARKGVRPPNPCGATELLRGHPGLEGRSGSIVAAREPAGDQRWRARVLDARRGLRCLAIRLGERLAARHECEQINEERELILAVVHGRRGDRSSTAVAVSGPRLRSVELTSPDGTQTVPTKGTGRIALAVFAGIIDPDSLTIVASFRGWRERRADRAARRALADDPLGGERWEAVAEKAYPRRRDGFTCVRWVQTVPRFSHPPFDIPVGECGDVIEEPLFFAVRGAREYIRRRSVLTRRAVFGAVGRDVADVTITGPGGSRSPELSRRGRGFISMFPRAVSVEELSVTFSFRDGTAKTYEGSRGVGVDTPRRPPLGRAF